MIKPQYVDQIPKAVKGTVQQLLDKKNERNNIQEICDFLGMLVYFIIVYTRYLEYIHKLKFKKFLVADLFCMFF